MSNIIKENTIIQLTKLLVENGKNIGEYTFENCDYYNIYLVKSNGLKMIISLIGIKSSDVLNDSKQWQDYKINILDLFHKLESIYLNAINSHKENDSIDMLCKIDLYLSQNILEHFIKEKGTIKIIDPTLFSSLDLYLMSFRNLNTFKKFIESKIFFKVKSIIN